MTLSPTHSRPAECGSGQASQARPDHPNRVVSPSRGLPLNLQQVAPAEIDLLYPQTKVGDILDSGPSRRRRRNFLVDAITQKQINFFLSNLVHMLRVPKGRSLF